MELNKNWIFVGMLIFAMGAVSGCGAPDCEGMTIEWSGTVTDDGGNPVNLTSDRCGAHSGIFTCFVPGDQLQVMGLRAE